MSSGASRFSGAARLADDTRQRFLTEIVRRVPLDRLVEVHLFTPIRQGGVETGVAIVAAVQAEAASPAAEPQTADAAATASAAPDATTPEPTSAPTPEPTDDAAAEATLVDDAPSEAPLADPTEAAADVPDDAADVVLPEVDVADALAEAAGAEDAVAEDETPAPPPQRLTVFTARYRLTLKGPDRGKWDADVVAEAEAPLVTVEAVVRGVQRRAGDAADPDRLSAEAVAKIVGTPPPAPAPPRAR